VKKPIIDLDNEFEDDGEEPMPFVMIRWCDAMSHTDEWKYQDDLIEWANGIEWLVETTGWILKECKEYILIAGQRGALNDGEYQYAMVMKIPKTWIKLRVDLTNSI
jgi:hypothetical protein